MAVDDEKYIKVKLREFNGVVKTKFLGHEIHACIACITVDSVMRMEKKNYPQAYLKECKYKSKKINMIKFIDTKLESIPGSELGSETELKSKSELESDTE